MFLANVALWALARGAHVPGNLGVDLTLGTIVWGSLFLAFPLVGALIASRRPRNPVGWICLADGLLWTTSGMLDYYGPYGLASPGSVPFPVGMAGINDWLWVPAVGLLGTFLLLLFPDGRLPSRRWRPLAWLSGAVIVSLIIGVMLAPGPMDTLEGVRNPFGLEGQRWVAVATYVVLPLLPLCMLASGLSLVLRFRRSTGEERQQIKWIAFAASVVVILYLVAMIASLIHPSDAWSTTGSVLWLNLLTITALMSFITIPIAVGFAMLRYRLYDIDVLINRALVYGSLTLVLAGLYAGTIVMLQEAFRGLTGQHSSLAIVASTLALAALFHPLRRRIQGFIDRRFYRRKYDARKILETFSARLRDETDLERLGEHLAGVVGEAMQPEHTSLWLRPANEPQGERGASNRSTRLTA
jgi:hypothetical protein